MKVLKFGGTSVGSENAIRHVIEIIKESIHSRSCSAVVVSALSGVTDALIQITQKAVSGSYDHTLLSTIEMKHFKLCEAFLPVETRSHSIAWIKESFYQIEDLLNGIKVLRECSPKIKDEVASFGERMSAYVLSQVFSAAGISAQFCDARQFIKTDHSFGKGKVNFELSNELIRDSFQAFTSLPIVTGFIASTTDDITTTLGRGGSDYTAAIIGAALGVDEIEIWTDVDGIMTADPRIVQHAIPIASLSYEEAMELSHFGAKVIYPPSIHPACIANIPVSIKNTFNRSFPGSVIHTEHCSSDFPVTGISSIKEVSLIRVQGPGMQGVSGTAMRLFKALSSQQISAILITQASSEHTICVAVLPHEIPHAQSALNEEFNSEIKDGLIDTIIIDTDLSVISVVGENMRHTPGISAQLFQALGSNGINIRAIAQGSSELNISAVVSSKDRKKAINAVHDSFFLSDLRTAHLFIIGDGLIGSTLLTQIATHRESLRERYSLDLKLMGVTNTRNMIISEQGLPIQNTKGFEPEETEEASLSNFVDLMLDLNLPHCVLIDCTASDIVPNYYPRILDANISIVTPNKRSLTAPLEHYDSLKKVEKKRGVRFFYETCVGAGLPIISTLHDLLKSGDKIIKIEAVLSGTLSYLFNQYTGESSFASLVKSAQDLGFTEPDPRDDLSGTDVARKLLILAREIGLRYELSDVEVENLVPESCRTVASVASFYEGLEQEDAVFKTQIARAQKNGQKLRYMGVIEEDKAATSLVTVSPDHPFYSLSGSDNIISFTTERYSSRPLVVKGPGAGPVVTAAGVFADIIRIIH